MGMMVLQSYVGMDTSDNTVVVPTGINFANINFDVECDSGVRFGSDGNVYRANQDGVWQYAATWLLKGTASNYYIARTVNEGSLDTDAGTDLVLSTNRDYYITQTMYGAPLTCDVSFSITNSGGGTVYSGPVSYAFFAEKQLGGV